MLKIVQSKKDAVKEDVARVIYEFEKKVTQCFEKYRASD